jgi:hypothetical protein
VRRRRSRRLPQPQVALAHWSVSVRLRPPTTDAAPASGCMCCVPSAGGRQANMYSPARPPCNFAVDRALSSVLSRGYSLGVLPRVDRWILDGQVGPPAAVACASTRRRAEMAAARRPCDVVSGRSCVLYMHLLSISPEYFYLPSSFVNQQSLCISLIHQWLCQSHMHAPDRQHAN